MIIFIIGIIPSSDYNPSFSIPQSPRSSATVTLYVDQHNINANDTNSGNESDPFLTIQQAISVAEPGTEIIVKSGNYDECVNITSSGNSTEPISLKAEPLNSVNITRGISIEASYINVTGFNITNQLEEWGQNGILINGSNINITQNYVYNITGIAIGGSWNSDLRDLANISISNNSIYQCNKGFLVRGVNWTVSNNEVNRLIWNETNSENETIYCQFYGFNHIIQNNYFHGTLEAEIGNSTLSFFYTNSTAPDEMAFNVVIEQNFCEGFANQSLFIESNMKGTHENISFVGNVILDCSDWGIDIRKNITNMVIIGNTFYNLSTTSIGVQNNSTALILNNIIVNSTDVYWNDIYSSIVGGYNIGYNISSQIIDDLNATDFFENPLFYNASSPIGDDKLPFTVDDGLNISASSPAHGAGYDNTTIGAYGNYSLLENYWNWTLSDAEIDVIMARIDLLYNPIPIEEPEEEIPEEDDPIPDPIIPNPQISFYAIVSGLTFMIFVAWVGRTSLRGMNK